MILLVGYGYWGKNLARNFSKELSAVCEQDLSRQQEIKKLYPGVAVYSDVTQALCHIGITAVVIATKANSHYALAQMALDHGLHVWIEKPACPTLQEMQQLSTQALRQNLQIFVDHTFCYHPAINTLRNIDIGQPLYYDSTRISLGLFQPDVDVLLDLVIHDLAILDYLYPNLVLQDRTIVRNCHVNNQANQVIVCLKFNTGFTATINANWISPVKQRQIILAGRDRSIIYDDLLLDKVKIYETGIIEPDFNATKLGAIHTPQVNITEALSLAKDHFLDCIIHNKTPLTSIDHAIKIMRWVL
jgi:predicted dehydrogenase